MPAYVSRTVADLIEADATSIVGALQQAYAADGFSSQYTRQTQAWDDAVRMLQAELRRLLTIRPQAADWAILLEYPLYRLRRRIDLVILAEDIVVVVECKVGARDFVAADRRQVEEYALDLRDFHAESHGRRIVPVLWSTAANYEHANRDYPEISDGVASVAPVTLVGAAGLANLLASISLSRTSRLVAEVWDRSVYRPVPNVIEAATSIFAGHGVKSITNADADNLRSAAARLIALVQQAKEERRRYLLLLSGVPGSGKTLAGLYVVHDETATGTGSRGDIVYLSGNTPLVVVLREALARDEAARPSASRLKRSLADIRRDVRARIQHVNDFLQESLRGATHKPPHDHVIVFDEAQRAWDAKQGEKKFNRSASEPALLLELLSRHSDWCACICLVGGGQEINAGEEGVLGWGEALRQMLPKEQAEWSVYAPPDVLRGGPSAGSFTLGEFPRGVLVHEDPELQLRVPQRSYRSPGVSGWVNQVIRGDSSAARTTAEELGEYPVMLTRSLETAKRWLLQHGRGERRCGLLASSGARRLRAEGLGMMLNATAGNEIAHWYLNPPGDIRSSYALEVPANEYTCQGLELDFTCICWGGDFLWDSVRKRWSFWNLSGTYWKSIRALQERTYVENSYRVLLTRAREGLILWVPEGDDSDPTRATKPLNDTADFLEQCGAGWLEQEIVTGVQEDDS